MNHIPPLNEYAAGARQEIMRRTDPIEETLAFARQQNALREQTIQDINTVYAALLRQHVEPDSYVLGACFSERPPQQPVSRNFAVGRRRQAAYERAQKRHEQLYMDFARKNAIGAWSMYAEFLPPTSYGENDQEASGQLCLGVDKTVYRKIPSGRTHDAKPYTLNGGNAEHPYRRPEDSLYELNIVRQGLGHLVARHDLELC